LKADISQLNLPHGTKNFKKIEKEKKLEMKMDVLKSITKQPGEFAESVLKKKKKKKKATEGRICAKGMF